MLGLTPLPFCPCSARELEKARLQLQDEVRQLGSQLLEERKRRETHEALARRLQKRVLLLTKVPASPGADPVHPPRPADPSPPRPQSQPSSPQPAPASTLSRLSRPTLASCLPHACTPSPQQRVSLLERLAFPWSRLGVRAQAGPAPRH